MKKLTVLMIHNHYQIPGGEDTVVENEKKMLEDHGHKVILYSRSNCELKDMSRLHKLLLPVTTVFNPKTYHEAKRIIREQKVDIVHVHNTLNLVSPSAYYAAFSCKVPVVQTVHNFRLLCPGAAFFRDGHICEDCVKHGLGCAVKHKCYRGSRLQTLACVISTWIHRALGTYKRLNYICLTEFNREKLLALPQVRQDRVFVKPNFVESDGMPVPGSVRSGFAYVGRLDPLKGIHVLLEAWKLLGPEAPELTICGTGPMEAWCKSYITDNRLKSVHMVGQVSNQEAKEHIASARALILPTQWYEGFPMSMAEAFSLGTPVIASDIGNAGALVEEGINGWKFESFSPTGLAEIVNSVTDISESTYQCYCSRYTVEKGYMAQYAIYEEILYFK